MIPSAAITAACGTGNTRSAQMRAMPRAHAQRPWSRSTSTASLASWGVGILAQEASTSNGTPITIRRDLTSPPKRRLQLLGLWDALRGFDVGVEVEDVVWVP